MMKKNLIVLALLFAATVSASAEDAYVFNELGNSIIPYVQLDLMCSNDSFLEDSESSEMQLLSRNLDPFYKELLYSKYSQDPWGIAAVNFCTGGLGSLINGNILSGTILQTGFAASYTFMVLGLIEQAPDIRSTEFLIAEIGAAAFGLAGLVIPFFETKIFNDSLKESLNM